MKAYKFAKITVRPYPNMCDVNNKWIFTPEIGVVINVSQKYKAEIVEAVKQKGVEYYHFPLDEEVPDIGWENIKKAVKTLMQYDNTDKRFLRQQQRGMDTCSIFPSPQDIDMVHRCTFIP